MSFELSHLMKFLVFPTFWLAILYSLTVFCCVLIKQRFITRKDLLTIRRTAIPNMVVNFSTFAFLLNFSFKNAEVEQLTKVVLSHGEEKGLIVKDPL